MTHDDYPCLHQIHSQWQKEQQLIRRKFQIPYHMTYTSRPCHSKPNSLPSHTNSSLNIDRITVTHQEIKRKSDRADKHCLNNDFRIPPMFCSKCHSNLTECSCENGIGQWWRHLHKRTSSTDKSLSNSIPERHVSFETSLIDLSSIEQTNSHKPKLTPIKHQYVLIDWTNRLSLLNFIQTTQLTRNSSNLTLEQLHQLITDHNHIHIFNSIFDLILTMNKEQQEISLCQIYIDPLYYSTLDATHPFSQSHIIADNVDLNRTLYTIQKLAILLGIKLDPYANEFSYERLSTKQRKSILNQQSVFLASKIPYNTFRHPFVSMH